MLKFLYINEPVKHGSFVSSVLCRIKRKPRFVPWGLDEQDGELQGPKDSFNQLKGNEEAAENTAFQEKAAAATDRNL